MPTLAKALIIEIPDQPFYKSVFWPVFTLSSIAILYLMLGILASLIAAVVCLFFWARYELQRKSGTGKVVVAWWRAQVHLYEKGIMRVSIPFSSISSVAWLQRNGHYLFRKINGSLIINTKSGVYICPIGPLPRHVAKRLRHFVQALKDKKQGIEAPEKHFEI